ncbi:MAG: TonB-dependent receptor [Candidatus Eremiobacteraeota bacterium]|nr:TonB-dependent receptor [Candidatus Eremiobacteraeota bacterium]
MSSRRFVSALVALIFVAAPLVARAGTTGTLRGRVTDSATHAPIAGAEVTATSPSQVATVTSDASGSYAFVSLEPDTYTVSATRAGYEPQSQPGVTIQADQSRTIDLAMIQALKTIAHTSSRSAQSLVRAGVTSDVYSINASGQKATQALGGSGSMMQAYGAIQSAPGVNVPTTQAGWYQGVYVRGGDTDQVAYEFDGLPVTRQSDLAPITTLTALGNQEVQVYTGGTSATSNSSGLAGYINQVIKSGTYPGYADANLTVGGPAFYHEAIAEASGATPDRLFSYYVGLAGSNQDYRYGSQYNGADNPAYFYPLLAPSKNPAFNVFGSGILDGSAGSAPNYGAVFAPGPSYAQSTNYDRENIVNLHFGIPHKSGTLRDDVQMLYITGGINTWFYSSQNDLGINPSVAGSLGFGYPLPYLTSTNYLGKLMQAPDSSKLATGNFPSQNPYATAIGPNQRDGSYNGYSIEKFQYQKNFSPSSYLRFLGYGEWSDWFISGPTSAQLAFGAELADYEVYAHIWGSGLIYSNQLSPRHLLSLQSTLMTQYLQTYNATFSSTDGNTSSLGTNNYTYCAAPGSCGMYSSGLGTVLSSFVGNNGLCYNYMTGQPWSCFDWRSQGGPLPAGAGVNLQPGDCITASKNSCSGSAAAKAGAHWIVTENGQAAQVDNVHPIFSSYSATDLWQPNDKLTVNFGARLDHFAYATQDLESGYPARQFWFNAYDREHCGKIGQSPSWLFDPQSGTMSTTCPSGFAPMWLNGAANPGVGLTNVPAGLSVFNVLQPRASATYTLDANTVLRASLGKYARAEASSYYQYNTYQQNLASFISQFYSFGYTTPDHGIYPDTSYNYDLSLEKHLKGTNVSFKLTPFFRSTSNQVQYKAIDALGGTLAGLNVGTQHSYGVELSLQGGDFAQNGFSYLLSYTYTNNKVKFSPINGQSVIDNMNQAIEQFNSFTKACSGVKPGSPNWVACGSGQFGSNAAPTLPNIYAQTGAGSLNVPNPYYKDALQPLLDTNGWYTPYDTIPGPFSYSNGYEVPNVASLILNYKHDRFSITPSFHYVDGSYYGSPLVYPGYVPQYCSALPSKTPTTPGVTCANPQNFSAAIPSAIFIPDPYTGNRFDSLGSLREPWQFTMNLQASYDVSPRVNVTATVNNIVNICGQRGYAWDNSQICTFGNLPSNVLPPAGNFLTTPPSQLKYPYGSFFNITEVGATAVVQPINFFVNLSVKI